MDGRRDRIQCSLPCHNSQLCFVVLRVTRNNAVFRARMVMLIVKAEADTVMELVK